MKIKHLVAVSLTLASSHALAFQEKMLSEPRDARKVVTSVENRDAYHAFYFQAGLYQPGKPGFCSANSASACHCPLCMQLASQRS